MKIKLSIIPDTKHKHEFNMAADLYLLEHLSDLPCVFLRFYQWLHPTITLGYMQKPEHTLNLNAVENAGIKWIRRPTGGRAVLHDGDITYSCIFSKNIVEMGKTISDTYHLISKCLLKGLSFTGLSCYSNISYLDKDKTRSKIKLPCFLAPNRNEIMVKNKKLIGSAQKRTSKAILQHGSIPITGNFRNIPLYLNVDSNEQKSLLKLLHQKCTCLQEIIPLCIKDLVIKNLIRGFSETLQFDTETRKWNECEKDKISHISKSKTFQKSYKNKLTGKEF